MPNGSQRSEPMTPRKAVESLLPTAVEILRKDRGHASMLFVYGERGNVIIIIEFRDYESKIAAMLSSGRRTAHLHPYCVAFVSEAWVSKTMPPEGKEVHDMPDREESLVIVAEDTRGESWIISIPFSRIGGEIVTGESTSGENTRAFLLEWFWKGARTGIGN